MRVALVVGQFPALSETFILSHVTGLIDRGHEVEVLALTRRPQPATHPEVVKYRLVERTRYAASEPGGTWRRRTSIARLLVRAGASAPFRAVPIRRLLEHGREDAGMALAFRDLPGGRGGRFDIIHCHFGPHGLVGMALRNMGLLRGRLVTTFHGYDMSRVIVQRGRNVYDRLFQEGDLFLPISDYWRRELIEMGCPPEQIAVQRMGVHLDRFTFSPRRVSEEEPAQILTVARLTEKKGVEYAIRAVARVIHKGRDVRYFVAGEGPLRPDLERLIDDLGVSASVRLLGGVDSDRVSALMVDSHVLLAPSVTASDGNQEGLPVVLMEAMATGLPVISTRHTGIPELVEHDATGLLVEERDVSALVEQLERLLGDSALHHRLAVAARQRVEEEHDVEKLNDRLVELYHDLVS